MDAEAVCVTIELGIVEVDVCETLVGTSNVELNVRTEEELVD